MKETLRLLQDGIDGGLLRNITCAIRDVVEPFAMSQSATMAA